MAPSEVVREFFAAMQRRDWDTAAGLVDPMCVVVWPSSNESFTGPTFIEMNRAYPEGWALEVLETVGDGSRVAARVKVVHENVTFWCAGFYTVTQGRISAATEHWSTEGFEQPLDWRTQYSD